MKKYWILFKAFYQMRLEYRGDMIIYSVANAFLPIISLVMWLVTSTSGQLPYSSTELMLYFTLTVYMGILMGMWQSWFIAEDISKGDFSIYLLKPFSIFFRYLTEHLSDVLFKVIIISFPVVVFFITNNFWSSVRIDFFSLILSILSIVIGYLLIFLIELCIGLTSVWTQEIGYLKRYFDVIETFFSGKMIPLAFFPAGIGAFAIFMPFRYTISFPIEIVMNKLTTTQLQIGFAIEFIWLMLMICIYQIMLLLFNKNYQGYGA